MKNDYVLLAVSLGLLLVSVWIALPGEFSLDAGPPAKGQRDNFSPLWTPLSLKPKGYYKIIVEKGVIPGGKARKASVKRKKKRNDILVVGIAEIDGKKSAIIHIGGSRRGGRDVVAGEGEEVNGWKVIAIKETSVVLEKEGEKVELIIFSPQGSKRRRKLVLKRPETRQESHKRAKAPKKKARVFRRPRSSSVDGKPGIIGGRFRRR